MIWRTKMQARVQGMVQFKDSVCLKLVQIGSSEFRPWTPSKVGLKATLDKGSETKSPGNKLNLEWTIFHITNYTFFWKYNECV